MMQAKFYIATFLLLAYLNTFAQDAVAVKVSTADSLEVMRLLQLSKSNFDDAPDKAISFAEEAKVLAEEVQYYGGVALALKNIGIAYYYQGKDVEALDYWQQSYETYKASGDQIGEANILSNIGAIYFNQGDDAKALEYYLQSLTLAEKTKDKLRILTALNNIGGVYFNKKASHDKALQYFLKALPLAVELEDKESIGTIAVNIGEIYFEKGNDAKALEYFNQSEKAFDNSENSPYVYNAMGKVYVKQGKYDLAITYHNKALAIAEKLNGNLDIVQSLIGMSNAHIKYGKKEAGLANLIRAEKLAIEGKFNKELKDIYQSLATTYSLNNDYKNAFVYQTKFSSIKDTLYNIETDKKLGSLQFDFEIRKKEGEISILTKNKELQETAIKRQRMAILGSLIGGLLILFTAVNLYKTLNKLKSTQAQLVHSTKMASLGELTAGIAHEIQNPLNFVNNFSQVSSELIVELDEELKKGEIEEVKSLVEFLKSNLDKINHHGNRAAEIVKGMLEHSRTNTGIKEPTDINALSGEFIKLSHQGIFAKDKSFNATFETHFDPNLPKVEIVSQEIGRVILNIFTNAFYAVNEKSKKDIQGYAPKVIVSTAKAGDNIVIKVADNGTGIPANIRDKIFQPFFTTKPTGQGTGLGLSLSYDIVKAHGGALTVASTEGEGTEFTITLPVNND
jgi:two-component system, NtrC family, sensor kinase